MDRTATPDTALFYRPLSDRAGKKRSVNGTAWTRVSDAWCADTNISPIFALTWQRETWSQWSTYHDDTHHSGYYIPITNGAAKLVLLDAEGFGHVNDVASATLLRGTLRLDHFANHDLRIPKILVRA